MWNLEIVNKALIKNPTTLLEKYEIKSVLFEK